MLFLKAASNSKDFKKDVIYIIIMLQSLKYILWTCLSHDTQVTCIFIQNKIK